MSILDGLDICGINANRVPDAMIDPRPSLKDASQYSKLHVSKMEDILADHRAMEDSTNKGAPASERGGK